MSSIVIDLQDEILSSNCDIVQILRRAHVIAVKLGLKEFDQWISYELNGYPDQNACPDYRKIRGILKAFNPYHGWIPAVITDGELETVICEKKISNSSLRCSRRRRQDSGTAPEPMQETDIYLRVSSFSSPFLDQLR